MSYSEESNMTAFSQPEVFRRFYERRYADGYMDEWDAAKKRRVFELVRRLNLPPSCRVLDFGCGNGVLTDVIRQALPGREIYGTDISLKALRNARRRYPQCVFSQQEDLLKQDMRFEFIFTHHVWEHVFDVATVWEEMLRFAADRCSMLHILPCGNPGTLEYRICTCRSAGIDHGRGNRFFFEDEGHVRRLRTEDIEALARETGFKLVFDRYACRYYGAIEWITREPISFVMRLCDPRERKNRACGAWLVGLGAVLLLVSSIRRIPALVGAVRRGSMKAAILSVALLPFLLLGWPMAFGIERFLRRKSDLEWEASSRERPGSEMYLYMESRGERPTERTLDRDRPG